MPSVLRPVSWVVFDLGETLVDETSNWQRWAEYLGVPSLTFFAVLGAMISQRRPHTDAFAYFKPDFDFDEDVQRKAAAGLPWHLTLDDLYADALPTLARLREQGYRLAVMANQPVEAIPLLASLPVDLYATSAGWGVSKPDPAFFARVVAEVGVEARQIAYVGDRVDNDVLPAKASGMLAVHLRRGPWGVIQSEWPEAHQADLRVISLDALVKALGPAGRAEGSVQPPSCAG
jgi:FMN phosphatase YigB (HAD superfamily)